MCSIEKLAKKELNKHNYLIENNETYTAIYFSSNGLFNDVETFERNIVEKNKFEFYKTKIDKATKHIYIRDINRKWYSNGINKELDSVEKVVEFLKEETKGTKIITLGSSMGGYGAVLFGILLNAEYIFNFSGKCVLDEYYNKYSSIVGLIKNSNIPIFYMVPSLSQRDVKQFCFVKDFNNVHVLLLKSAVHGVPVVGDTLKSIINSDLKTLNKMYSYKNRDITEVAFILKYFGIQRFFLRMIKKNTACTLNKYFIHDKNKKILALGI